MLKTILLTIIADLFICINANAQGPTETVTALETYVEDVAAEFDVSEYLLASLIYEESRFLVKENLTQITSVRWYKEGFEHCGSDDKSNPYVNIRVCGYYLNKWAQEYEGEPGLWLRFWNEGYENALEDPGYMSGYAKRIIKRAEQWETEQEIPFPKNN